MLKDLSREEIIYLAGFFDGEGCISIVEEWKKESVNPGFRLSVSITQCDYEFLEYWHQKTGLGITCVQKARKEEHRDLAYWSLNMHDGLKLLRAIYPYLIIKKDQADVAFDFLKVKYDRRKYYTVPKHIVEKRKYYMELLAALKHKPTLGDDVELPEEPQPGASQLYMFQART